MAVVSAVTTLRIDNSVSHADSTALTWVCTAAQQDTAAGSSVVVTITYTNGGGVTPGDAEALTLRYVDDAGTIIKTVALGPTTASQTDTFYFTSDGLVGGSPRCGTIEMKLQATRTTLVAYDFETDGSPNTAPAGFHAHTVDRGWIRGTTTRAEAVSNASLGGALTEPAQYDESLYVRLTEGAVSYVARALTVASSAGSLSSATNSTTAAQRDVTFTTVCDERFPAALTNVTWSVTVPNATLTGSPDWTATTTTEADCDVDPRLTCTHHFQIDDNTFALASDDNSNSMLSTQSGFLWTIVKAARGTGINGLTVAQTLTPVNPGTAASDTPAATTTQDGQAGVSARLDWTASKPGGTWNKAVDVTAPSDIDGSTYLVSSTDVYTMVAPDPRLSLRVEAGDPANPGEPWLIGSDFTVGMAAVLFAGGIVTRKAIDTGTATFIVASFNAPIARLETLASDMVTWEYTATPHLFSATVSPGDTLLYLNTDITGVHTAQWGDRGSFYVEGYGEIDGTPKIGGGTVGDFEATAAAASSSGGGGVFAPYGGARRVDVDRISKRLKELEERTEVITQEITTKETLVVERMTEVEGKQYARLAVEQAGIRQEIELLTALVLANA